MSKIVRLFKSFGYAFKGLFKTFREEQNLKIQVISGVLVVAAGFYLGLTQMEWIVIILTIAVVILMEIVNSAIERVSDVLKPRINDYVKEIKDIMAAAVMIASIAAIAVGILVFAPYLAKLFNS